MNDPDSQVATTKELIEFAKQRGLDLNSTSYDWGFLKGDRFISLWRKEGKVHYNMQGRVHLLPQSFKASAGAFRGMWHETGSLMDLQTACEFLKAWLIEQKEVDELRPRNIRSQGIG